MKLHDIFNEYARPVDQALIRDLKVFSHMVYPGDSEQIAKKRFSYQLKTLLTVYSKIACEYRKNYPHVDGHAIGSMLGERFGIYSEALGGWEGMALCLINGQQQDFNEEVIAQTRKGFITGCIFTRAITNKCSISKAAADYAKEYTDGTGPIGEARNSKNKYLLKINPEVFQTTIWQKFKNVAHFWAAFNTYFECNMEYWQVPLMRFDEFSCKILEGILPEGYEGFHLLSGLYMRVGCDFKPPRSSKTLLNPEACVKNIR